ncbi:cytidine deaminase [Amylibacter sp.]|jgi:cytidine deaminase|nr:cytidine deaminase [Amylibacter sp.]
MTLTDAQIQSLKSEAKAAMEQAHAPYSNFTVGAAILMEGGTIIRGANIENASFGATICAERSAIASALSQGHRGIKAIAVTNATDTKITPCGICRQVIYEYGTDIPIICSNQSGEHMIHSISDLLPHAFTL